MLLIKHFEENIKYLKMHVDTIRQKSHSSTFLIKNAATLVYDTSYYCLKLENTPIVYCSILFKISTW
jgi:hypothetical protein